MCHTGTLGWSDLPKAVRSLLHPTLAPLLEVGCPPKPTHDPIPASLTHRPGVSSLANIQVLTPLLSCSGPRCWQQSRGCCSTADAGSPPAVRPRYRRFRRAEEAEMSWAQLNTNHLLLTPGPKAETTKSNLDKTGHLFPFRNIGNLLLNTPTPSSSTVLITQKRSPMEHRGNQNISNLIKKKSWNAQ